MIGQQKNINKEYVKSDSILQENTNKNINKKLLGKPPIDSCMIHRVKSKDKVKKPMFSKELRVY